MVFYLMERYVIGIKRACKVIDLTRSMWYYHSKKDDVDLVVKLSELAQEYPTRGFDEYYNKLRREGYKWNRKRLLRVYRSMKLGLRRKHKKRIISRVKQPLEQPNMLNQCWSMDFMSDALADGRKLRILNIIDDCNREALAIEVGLNYPAKRVIQTLEELEGEIGLPKSLRCDNGPEFIAKVFQKWCKKKRIELKYIQPGKPMQNGYIERFNRFYREDILDAYWFEDLHQIRALTNKWREDYNENHPHKSLGNISPREYRKRNLQEASFLQMNIT